MTSRKKKLGLGLPIASSTFTSMRCPAMVCGGAGAGVAVTGWGCAPGGGGGGLAVCGGLALAVRTALNVT